MIYLDNNATTPVDPEVYDAVFSSLKRDIGNPSSTHAAGLHAREAIVKGRARVAELIGCAPEEIIFTSGGTESNNLAILGTALRQAKGHIITSAIEHPSVLNACRYLESLGFAVTYAPADADGIVSVDAIRKAVRRDTLLITVMHANNETGVIQPVAEIGSIAGEQGIAFHVDAAQSVGKMPFSVADTSIRLMTLVSHKFYGPKGIGALYVRKETPLKPILFGAGHEQGLRPGTENVAGIVGIGKACQIALRDMKLRVSHTRGLRDLLYSVLQEKIPGVSLNGHVSQRLPNTLNIRIPGIRALDLIERLKDSVAASAGSACHAGKDFPSAVLKAMGLSDKEALSSIRLSVGKDNTEEEAREAAGIISLAAAALGNGQ
ncbi:MAG: cysteine desulfurase family protein [Nitrospiraceae bacterium]|nr:cysteine desulfurase family protein [Nitrospiraceae bacterium]